MLSDKMLKQKPAIFFEFTVIWLNKCYTVAYWVTL